MFPTPIKQIFVYLFTRIILPINLLIMFLIIYFKWLLNSSTDTVQWNIMKCFSLSDLHSENPKKMF